MEFTLSNVISRRFCDPKQGWIDKEFVLTEIHKDAFVRLMGKGCSQSTKAKLTAFIKYPHRHKDRYEYKRIIFDSNGIPCQFCPNQDWTPEMAALRKMMCT